MVDEKRLDEMAQEWNERQVINSTVREQAELLRLARLGLWAEKVAVPALEKYSKPEMHSMDKTGFVWFGDYFDYDTARTALAALPGKEKA